MSHKIPRISGKRCVKALQKAGFYVRGQRGSHIAMKKEKWSNIVTIPNHRELATGTLRSIIKGAGLTVEEFNKLL